tara:strand:+ start:216 stop:449 length:234 start_codon:yes stop_codon:yes gene_type:complete
VKCRPTYGIISYERGEIVYYIQIISISRNQPVGPKFFTGPDEDYKTLGAGREAAEAWINSADNPADYKIKSQIVGCL